VGRAQHRGEAESFFVGKRAAALICRASILAQKMRLDRGKLFPFAA
jgi:hypothetical protein